MSQLYNMDSVVSSRKVHATILFESRVVPPPPTIIEPVDRRKDIPDWTTVHTSLPKSTPTSTATPTDTVPEISSESSERLPAAVSHTDDILPDLHPAVLYVVLLLFTLVLSTAILLYFVNFGAPKTSLSGLYRQTINFFRRFWFHTRTLYRTVVLKLRTHAAHSTSRYVPVGLENMDEDNRVEHEPSEHTHDKPHDNDMELDDLNSQTGQKRQGDLGHKTISKKHAKIELRGAHANGNSSPSPTVLPSRENLSDEETGGVSLSRYETHRIYASPSIFLGHPSISGVATRDFASEPQTARSPSATPYNNNFPRSGAPSPTSYSPTPSTIAEVNADPGSAASALAPTSNSGSSSDMSSGRFAAEIVAMQRRRAERTPSPLNVAGGMTRFPNRGRRLTEAEWILERLRFEREVQKEKEGGLDGQGASASREGSSEESRYPVASAEEAAYWDAVAIEEGRVGERERRDSREASHLVDEARSPEFGERQRLLSPSQNVENQESATSNSRAILPKYEHDGEMKGQRGVVGGIERAVDRAAENVATWVASGYEKSEGAGGPNEQGNDTE